MLTGKEESAPDRDKPIANPLTYYERQLLVSSVFQENGLTPYEFSIVPLPINFPDMYKYYVPMDALFFLTIYDKWGKKKRDYFQSLGLKTHVLWEVPPEKKGISASDIRARIIDGRPCDHLVPQSSASLLNEWNIADRLRHMQGRG